MPNNPAVTNEVVMPKLRRTIYNKNGIKVVEYEPQRRMVSLTFDNPLRLYLSFPYMQFAEKKGYLFVSVTNDPVENLEKDEVCFLPLPNIFPDGSVLLSGLKFKFSSPPTLDELISAFWNSGFNNRDQNWIGCGLLGQITLKGKSLIKNYQDWADISGSEDFATQAIWPKPRNLLDFLKAETVYQETQGIPPPATEKDQCDCPLCQAARGDAPNPFAVLAANSKKKK